jgi:membrane fusion protein (multidrug efflux system)
MQFANNLSGLQRKNLIVAAALVGLSLSGCDGQTQSQRPPSVPEVATVTVSAQSVVLTTELPGRTSPFLVA